ncbi:ABC transporter permease [Desulfofundulus thermosubterraneus]|uniref:Putative ABC transport system permease protein n=1 Tax=Desulfofundulus thermosubterraneus DSM 16057 TaxID=1121432 RepID=A0A1M6C014_9FIRM|nr:ABC transporter permease [Desulfofundulus thermosubterraneus]SHI54211.1 putative ABC transport system permease protein [Desulfofundulus thermosubterraneus DSM 16057]
MNFIHNLEVAINGLRANKMRSFLTMLGIIIGVAAVIIMISVGQGASKKIAGQIASMGSNLLIVFPGAGQGPVRGASGSVNTLTLEDAEAIAGLSMVAHVAPELSTNATIGYASQTWTAQVVGTTPEMQMIKDWPVSAGSFFTGDDVRSAAMVAVLGKTVVDNLYLPGTNPVGSTIRINRLPFTVVGVLAPKGASLTGQDQDNVVYIPVSAAQKRLMGVNYVRLINVQAETPESMNFVQSSIENLLRQRHRLVGTSSDDFNVRNLTSVLETAESTTAVMTLLLASVAAVSLLVGGIGTMNIMLVSVTERTREIGLRMAVGATESNIRNQFLVESLVLCLIGGIAGILVGIAGSKIISKAFGWPTFVTVSSILLSAGFSAAVGIFFGYYPAKKAAGLDPIEALRFER